MKAAHCFALFLLSTVLFASSSIAVNHLQFDNNQFNLTWNYLSATEEIEFEVRVKTTGYVALGLTKNNSGMIGLDLFAGGVNAGASYLKDYHVNNKTTPSEDAQQDYTLVSASESNGVTMVRCKRKLLTQDSNDLQIKAGDKVYFAWATHRTSDTLVYHANRGYSSQMYELVPAVVPTRNDSTTTPTPKGPTTTTSATLLSCSMVLQILAFFAALVAATPLLN